MRMTDKGVSALKPKAERYEVWEDGRSGFGVRVAPSGRKSWLFMYRFEGKARRMTLGRYPAMGLASAWMKYAEAKDKLDRGHDPGAEVQAGKRAELAAPTVGDVIDEYLKRSASQLRSFREVRRILEREVRPTWGSRKAKSITRRDLVVLLDAIVDRGAPFAANRCMAWTRRMFRWARKRDILEVNPLSDIEAPGGDEVARERTLTDTEIVALWNGLPAINVSESIRLAAKLVLVTAQRPGEVAGARVDEFDLGRAIWNLPPERTKNGLPHVVPLSPLAIDLVETARETIAGNGWLLARRSGDAPISAISLATAFLDHRGRLGIPDLPKPDDAVAANVKTMVAWRRERRRLAYAPHDLRRTAASRMTELGHPRFIVDKVLNHVEPGVGKIYDRHTYLPEKRRALEAWAARLEEILAGKKADDGKVVQLRPA